MKKSLLLLVLSVITFSAWDFVCAEVPNRGSGTTSEVKRASSSRPSKKELVEMFKDLGKNDKNPVVQNPFKRGTKKHEIFANFYSNIISNDAIATSLADMVYPYWGSDIDFKKLSAAWIYDKVRVGIVKLPPKDLFDYFSIMEQMLENSENIDECASLSIKGLERGNYEIFGRLDDQSLETWLRIAFKAVTLGIDDQVIAPTVTKEQEEVAWQIFFSGVTEDQRMQISRISDNTETSTSAEQCWIGVFMVSRLNKMEGEPKKWAVYSMIKAMSN